MRVSHESDDEGEGEDIFASLFNEVEALLPEKKAARRATPEKKAARQATPENRAPSEWVDRPVWRVSAYVARMRLVTCAACASTASECEGVYREERLIRDPATRILTLVATMPQADDPIPRLFERTELTAPMCAECANSFGFHAD
jgi:hypothetical protein